MSLALNKKRFTADEYQRMGQAGILSEDDRVELIDGEVIAMSAIGTRHNACIGRATRDLVRAAGDDAIVLPQGSVRLSLYYEPEPDLTLLRPRADFYASRHAAPQDILLIVEIADSSIDYDRGVKAHIYAKFGIPEYWLADLNANVLWCYSMPDQGQRTYQRVEPHRRGESIAPTLLPSCVIAADALLME